MQKHQVAGEAGPRAPSWYLRRGDKRYGPLGDRELLLLVERGGLRTDDLLWKPGFSSWKSVHAVCDLKTSPEDTSRKVASTPNASPPVEPTQDASYVPDGLSGDAPSHLCHYVHLWGLARPVPTGTAFSISSTAANRALALSRSSAESRP